MSLFSFLRASGTGEMGTQSSSSANLQVIIRPGGAVNCWNIPSIITLTSSGESECKLLLHLIRRFNWSCSRSLCDRFLREGLMLYIFNGAWVKKKKVLKRNFTSRWFLRMDVKEAGKISILVLTAGSKRLGSSAVVHGNRHRDLWITGSASQLTAEITSFPSGWSHLFPVIAAQMSNM